MPQNLPKKLKLHLRKLAKLAYERELSAATHELLDDLHHWERKEMDVFQLNENVHRFHNGISRELYVRYTGLDAVVLVTFALQRGVLSRKELGEEVILALKI